MFKPFFKKRAVVITTEALVHHSVKNFNYLEGYVRDSFDWFFHNFNI